VDYQTSEKVERPINVKKGALLPHAQNVEEKRKEFPRITTLPGADLPCLSARGKSRIITCVGRGGGELARTGPQGGDGRSEKGPSKKESSSLIEGTLS